VLKSQQLFIDIMKSIPDTSFLSSKHAAIAFSCDEAVKKHVIGLIVQNGIEHMHNTS
jgi:hypothetical protein